MAAAALLAEEGWAGFSMSDVGRRAEVSAGALYDRVGDKDSLFLAVHEREMTRIIAASARRLDPGEDWERLTTARLVQQTVTVLGDGYREEAPLLKAFILRAAEDDVVRDEGSRLTQHFEEAVVRLLLTRAADYPHPDPIHAAQRAYRLAADSLAFRTAFGVDFAAPDESVDRWIHDLGQACGAYLLTPAAP